MPVRWRAAGEARGLFETVGVVTVQRDGAARAGAWPVPDLDAAACAQATAGPPIGSAKVADASFAHGEDQSAAAKAAGGAVGRRATVAAASFAEIVTRSGAAEDVA